MFCERSLPFDVFCVLLLRGCSKEDNNCKTKMIYSYLQAAASCLAPWYGSSSSTGASPAFLALPADGVL